MSQNKPSLLDRIAGMEKPELERMMKNALERLETDPRAAAIVNACEIELRQYRPKATFHRQVEEVMEEVAARHGLLKLENNMGKPGVRPGGGMFAGWVLAEFYVGFKCVPFKRQAVFGAVLVDRDSELEFWVYDLDHEKAKPGEHGLDYLPAEWDLGIPALRTKDPDQAAAFFKRIIAPYTPSVDGA